MIVSARIGIGICIRAFQVNVKKCIFLNTNGLANRQAHFTFVGNRLVYYFPKSPFKIILPTLRSKPCLVVGMPVLRAIFCLTAVIPTALLREKLNPGIFISVQ